MPVAIFDIQVENPDQLRNAGAYDTGALIRVQSSATETGTYADISGTGSTPTIALVAAIRTYTAYDPLGTSTTWYRWRFENAGGTRLGDWSAAFQVGGDEGVYICSVADVKQRLGIAASDTKDDEWLAAQVRGITEEIEGPGGIGRRLRPDPLTGTKTIYLDYAGDGTTLWMPRGVRSITYLGVASSDQSGDGSGTYTEITTGYYVDPPEHERSDGWPGTRVTLGSTATAHFTCGRRTIKMTGTFAWAAVPRHIRSLAEMCIVGAYRARSSGGASSYTIGVEGERTYVRLLTVADLKALAPYRDWIVG